MQVKVFKRSFYNNLLEWKRENSTQKRKALLVCGARQIGKTFLIDQFAKNEYDNVIKIDFIQNSQAKASFQSITSSKGAVEVLSLTLGKKLQPEKTLVFLDEVQEVPEVVTFAKYLVQDGRFDLVLSGSLLGVELKNVRSLPVGYMKILNMTPMSFEEFCWASGVPNFALEHVKNCYTSKEPVDAPIHQNFINLFRHYLITGGMPEAVQVQLNSNSDLGSVREELQEIVRLYREDISKYSQSRTLQIKAIFDAIPTQLAKENKRFQIKDIKSNAKFDRLEGNFSWLISSGAALKALNVTEPKLMLQRTAQNTRFKLFAADVGMLLAQYPAQVSIDALVGKKSINFGAVYENFFAQELKNAGVKLYYYRNSKKGEVDFLVETQAGKIIPVEIKSGKDYKSHRALNNLLETKEYGIEQAVVLSEDNVSMGQKAGKSVYYLPIYMAGLLAAEAVQIPNCELTNFNATQLKW